MGTACSDRHEHPLRHVRAPEEAELLGWDGYLFTEDHFDGWTLASRPNLFLAALAMRTSRLRLGHGVQVLHHPPPGPAGRGRPSDAEAAR
jgi:alkanesulfonate monooxygenase SsuD/methylene tetrahydromethanopterin reductase-like flavin-dependent oxidoreductase (luciferase family)